MTTINTQGFGVQLAPAGFSLEANKIFENYEAALTFVRTKPAAYVGSVITVKAPSTIDEVTYPAGVYNVTAVGENGALEQVGKETDLSGVYNTLEAEYARKEEIAIDIEAPEFVFYESSVTLKIHSSEEYVDSYVIVTEEDIDYHDEVKIQADGSFRLSNLPIGVRHLLVAIPSGNNYICKNITIHVLRAPVLCISGNVKYLTDALLRKNNAGKFYFETSPIVTSLEDESNTFYIGVDLDSISINGLEQITVSNHGQYIPMTEVTGSSIPATFQGKPYTLILKSPELKEDVNFAPVVKIVS